MGETLFQLRNGHFKKDTEAMLKFLIDDHPAGWSTINGADFSQAAGYGEVTILGTTKDEKSNGPQCYCHGERSEKGRITTHENAAAVGCEWAYAFKGDQMIVYSSYCDPKGKNAGHKMIGMFGMGDPKSEWRPVAVVDLNGKEPDWSKIERKA